MKKNFFSDGLSVDEGRVSVLMLSLIGAMATTLYTYVTDGDLTGNMLTLLQTLITAVAGINVANTVMEYFKKNDTDNDKPVG